MDPASYGEAMLGTCFWGCEMRLRTSILALALTVGSASLPAISQSNSPAHPTFAVVKTVWLPTPRPDGFWDYVSVDAPARKLFIGTENGVLAVDLDTNRIVFPFVPGRLVHDVRPLPDFRALSTNGADDTAFVFDAGSGQVFGSVKTGRHPDGAIFDAGSGLVLVTAAIGKDIVLIDPKKVRVVGRIDLGERPEAGASDGRGKVYINLPHSREVAVIDVAQRTILAHWPLPGCQEPTGLAVDIKSGVLVSSCDRKAIALRTTDGSVLATLDIGGGADAVIFDAARGLFFIPCGDDGTLAVISENSGAAPTVIQTVKTAKGARTAALDPRTGRIYLPTADMSTQTFKIEKFDVPKAKPGTFRLLVVSAVTPSKAEH